MYLTTTQEKYPFHSLSVDVDNAKTILEIIAPGFDKSEFEIEFKESDNLYLRVQGKKGIKKVANQYVASQFSKLFQLTRDVDQENVTAEYINGILRIELAHKKPTEPIKKLIAIN
jgi:HSP20 family molecular chaperone IbpA